MSIKVEKEGVQQLFLGEKGSAGVQFENMPFLVRIKGPTPGDQIFCARSEFQVESPSTT